MFCAFCAAHRLLNDYVVETLLWRGVFFTFSKLPFHVNCVSKRLQANNRVLCHTNAKRTLKSTQCIIMNFY